MTSETKRQRRRRDALRMKARSLRVRPWDAQARAADYLKVCSCWMCGNPRRTEKPNGALTLQERRRADDGSWDDFNPPDASD